jgi:hypothetical protein
LLGFDDSRLNLIELFLSDRDYKTYLSNFQKEFGKRAVSFLMPGEAYEYLEKELKGGETILFKGARYLEGIVEKLLKTPRMQRNFVVENRSGSIKESNGEFK